MDNVAIGSILTVAGAIIVFIYLAYRIYHLMNQDPEKKE